MARLSRRTLINWVTITGLLVIGPLAYAGAYEDYFQALERDDGKLVRALLERGFDPNTRNEQGQTGLFLAMRDARFAVATALTDRPDLRVNLINGHDETALMMAALKGHVDWMQRLLDVGAQAHKPGWSPIHYAATGPQVEAVKLLLVRGAPANALSPNGSTPLMMAARYGSEDSVRLLLKEGADPHLANELGLKASDFARLGDRAALSAWLAAL